MADLADALVVPPGAGERVGNVEFLALSEHTSRFNVGIITMRPGAEGPEAHVHAEEDDALTFVLGEREVAAPAGTFVLVPPGVLHTFANRTDHPVRVLNLHAPAGFDRRIKAD
ncbi:MAG: cupin domain-containing protein [Solirubrobacteraceae bacterium]